MTIQTRISPAQATAVAAVGVGALAFWMSFTALSDLATLYGVPGAQANALPLVIDGLTVVATIGAATLRTGRWYAWTLLIVSTVVSVAGNATHAHTTNGSPIAIGIAVTPPLFLLAVTHLSIMLASQGPAPVSVTVQPEAATETPLEVNVTPAPTEDVVDFEFGTPTIDAPILIDKEPVLIG